MEPQLENIPRGDEDEDVDDLRSMVLDISAAFAMLRTSNQRNRGELVAHSDDSKYNPRARDSEGRLIQEQQRYSPGGPPKGFQIMDNILSAASKPPRPEHSRTTLPTTIIPNRPLNSGRVINISTPTSSSLLQRPEGIASHEAPINISSAQAAELHNDNSGFVTAGGYRYGSRNHSRQLTAPADDQKLHQTREIKQRNLVNTFSRPHLQDGQTTEPTNPLDRKYSSDATDLELVRRAQPVHFHVDSHNWDREDIGTSTMESRPKWNFSPKLSSGDREQFLVPCPSPKKVNIPESAGMSSGNAENCWGLCSHLTSYGQLSRICVVPYSLNQVFQSSCMAVDLKKSSIELLFPINGPSSSSLISQARRREGFYYDEVFAGEDSLSRMHSLCIARMKQCLRQERNLVVIMGSSGVGTATESELPVQSLLGSGSTTEKCSGLVTKLLQELFGLLHPAQRELELLELGSPLSHGSRNRTTNKNTVEALKARLARERAHGQVIMSALVYKQGQWLDLLDADAQANIFNAASSSRNHNNNVSDEKRNNVNSVPNSVRVDLKADGNCRLRGAVRVEISGVGDFQRIAGVLQGRRTAIRDLLRASTNSKRGRLPADILQTPSGAWLSASTRFDHVSSPDDDEKRKSERGSKKSKRKNQQEPGCSEPQSQQSEKLVQSTNSSGTLLLQFAVSYAANSGLSTRKSKIKLFFLCPCGPLWELPDPELQLLSEGLRAIPHPAPPSVLRSSALCRLFLGEQSALSTDFLCLQSLVYPNSSQPEPDDLESSVEAVAKSLRLTAL